MTADPSSVGLDPEPAGARSRRATVRAGSDSRIRVSPGESALYLQLLLAVLKGDAERIRRSLNVAGFPAARFEAWLGRHQLKGYVYKLLADSPARDAVPADLLAGLADAYRRQSRYSRVLLAALRELGDAFARAGLGVIVLKGLALADRFFGGMDRRTVWDIDLLVRPADLAGARDVLGRLGYVLTSHVFLSERLSIRFTHALDFARGGVNVDLHWLLANHPSFRLDYDRIWRRRRPHRLEGRSFDVLAAEDELVFDLIAIARDLERGAVRLRSFVDAYRILQEIHAGVDWQDFVRERERENLARLCLNILALFLSLFDCRDEFPALAAVVERDPRVRPADPVRLGRLLHPARFGLPNKLWAAKLYETSRLGFLGWWSVSLPFRLAVYRPGRWSRFKRAVRAGLSRVGPKR